MKLKIEITMENAAFEEESGNEVARILRHLAGDIEGADILPDFHANLMDINGNKVGTAKAV